MTCVLPSPGWRRSFYFDFAKRSLTVADLVDPQPVFSHVLADIRRPKRNTGTELGFSARLWGFHKSPWQKRERGALHQQAGAKLPRHVLTDPQASMRASSQQLNEQNLLPVDNLSCHIALDRIAELPSYPL